ncbi:ABC transporter substrate-binding protein [Micromonospora phytophila]|uniref:ABC transporter substrate-binding protein n=1 Tax=Micromonospora phytophila TaxID=709888 RepID=UPI00202E60E6|nr:ABC transporter substrate-binding protein [Micromonospora phytophila]MCM0678331.1 ABC transporter substrate-binding protein [Micromonospora phytophila]
MATPATGPSALTRRGLLAATAGTLLLSACGRGGAGDADPASDVAPGGQELVVGASLELTGPGGPLGVLQERALAITAESLNADGLPVGNLRRTLRIEVRDNAGDPGLAARQATELVRRDGVHALVGGTLAETSMAMVAVAQQEQLPFLSLAFGDGLVVPLAQRTYVFKLTPDAGDMARRLARLIATQRLRRIVLVAADGLHGDSGVRAATGALRTVEIGLRRTVRLPRTGKDFGPAAQRAVDARPDGVVVWATAPDSAAAVTALRGAGYDGPVFLDAAAVAEETLEGDNATAVEGVYVVHPVSLGGTRLSSTSMSAQAHDEFVYSYIRRHGVYTGFAPYASDALRMIAEAARLSTSVDRGRMRAFLQNQFTDGMAGAYSFTPMRHGGMERDSLGVYTVNHGAWTRFS